MQALEIPISLLVQFIYSFYYIQIAIKLYFPIKTLHHLQYFLLMRSRLKQNCKQNKKKICSNQNKNLNTGQYKLICKMQFSSYSKKCPPLNSHKCSLHDFQSHFQYSFRFVKHFTDKINSYM